MRFPFVDEVFLAIVRFQKGHDFVSGEISKVGRAQDAAMDGKGEDAAGKIAIQDLTFPRGDHVSDPAHALGVPENFTGDAEFV